MAFEQRIMSGSLFVNSRKEKETHPDRQGNGLLVCPHCKKEFAVWISGWIKDLRQTTGKWLSLAFEIKEDKPEDKAPASGEGISDDIPF